MTRSPATWIALLIGNSRLHWACGAGCVLHQIWHTPHLPEEAIAQLAANNFNFKGLNDLHLPVLREAPVPTNLPTWCGASRNQTFVLASVVPSQTAQWQLHHPNARVITLADIPLTHTYPTLGVDRALAAYGSGVQCGTAALVMDAGTAFTVTGVDARLRFVGGGILPGVRLQLRSLGMQAANLPLLAIPDSASLDLPPRWARQTEAAMISGVVYTLASGVQGYIQDWRDRYPDSALVLTGGDRHILAAGLHQTDPAIAQHIHLSDAVALEGLAHVLARLGY